ncbi:uncharacterized protein EV420DRAFT_1521926 [Desarmillaria tabescens]|uniref:Uncharacterized protein n=1 Tax=Armillaria tabescens TaxID=1929756 RepID=A0AA39NC85_ARMTA|nr:uncharacterized protein EV420DRAFT_1521926 [Desarmillaria tabescens]KAK0462962.1 hypothetical protein EV420DRAFT_1521926 [Desarmillaria tabescens]
MSCSTYCAEYEREAFLEERRLKGRVYYRNRKFRLETQCNPQWTDKEYFAKTRDHDAFIAQYIREQRELISRRLEPLKQRAEQEKAREQGQREANGGSRFYKRGGSGSRQRQTEEERLKAWWEWISELRRKNEEEEKRKGLEEIRRRLEEEKRRRAEEDERKRTEEENARRRWQKYKEARRRAQAKEKEKEREQGSQLIEKRYKMYDEEWSKLKLKTQTKEGLRFSDIPWPTLFDATHPAAVTPAVVRSFFTDPKYIAEKHWLSPKKRFHMELLRWHTDKFSPVVKSVVDGDRQDVYDAAEVVVRVLNELKAQYQ